MTRAYGPLHKILDVALLAVLSVGALFFGVRATLKPLDASKGAAVIFAPWTSADHAFARAAENGTRLVRFGGLPFIVVMIADDTGYAARMLDNGAWLVVDPQLLAGCSEALAGLAKSS